MEQVGASRATEARVPFHSGTFDRRDSSANNWPLVCHHHHDLYLLATLPPSRATHSYPLHDYLVASLALVAPLALFALTLSIWKTLTIIIRVVPSFAHFINFLLTKSPIWKISSFQYEINGGIRIAPNVEAILIGQK